MKVLIAEDNPDNMDMLVRRLKRKGFEVCEATDGEQAVEAVMRLGPDLVLMDISMPIMSGIEAVREIRRREQGRSRVPVIALTAHAMESDKEESLSAGCDAFATKPIDFPALLDLIGKIRRA